MSSPSHAARTLLKHASPFAILLALAPLFVLRAQAAEISTATTAPVATDTSGDVSVTISGAITLGAPASAVTLNSNNSVTNAGTLTSGNIDGTRGVTVVGGNTGSVTNSGAIVLTEDYLPTDTDGDGNLDGPTASGTDRVGILVSGASPFVGDITSSGTIAVKGNNSAGVLIAAPMTGNLYVTGTTVVSGDNSNALRVTAPVTGNISVNGAANVVGANSTTISIAAPVSGQLHIQNVIEATGYRYTTRPDATAIAKLGAEDLLQGGPALKITSSIGGGVLLDKPPPIDANNADADGDGVADVSEGISSITSYGGAPAVQIGDSAGAAITLGAGGSYGFTTLGSITGTGIYDGVAATGAQIDNTIIGGGIRNDGAIAALSYSADATGLRLGAAANVPTLLNIGTISGAMTGESASAVTGVSIGAGASLPSITNSGSILATVSGAAANATAIRDLSNTLAAITNTGAIGATHKVTTGTTVTGANVAIDLSTQTIAANVTQTGSSAAIVGDVYFGSGADVFNVGGGNVVGNVRFGGGADQLIVNGGATVTGVIADSDNALAMSIGAGQVNLLNTGTLTVSSLSIGSQGVLRERLDPVNNTNGSVTVNGAAALQSGSTIAIDLVSLVPNSQTFRLLTANSITGASAITIGSQPFLYASSTTQTATTIDLTLHRKSAAELGLAGRAAAAYEPAFGALSSDASLAAAILGVTSQKTFQSAFAQITPQANGAEIAVAQARVQSLALNAFDRLTHHEAMSHQNYFWGQEIGFYAGQNANARNSGYDSYGVGLAFGLDRDITNNGYIGIGIAAGASSVDPDLGYKTFSNNDSLDAFVHGGVRFGNVLLGAWGGGGTDRYKSERNIAFTPEKGGAAIDRTAIADWSGTHAAGSVRATAQFQMGAIAVRPELAINALSVKENGYTESGAGGANLTVGSVSNTSANASAIVAIGLPSNIEETQFLPELRFGLRQRVTNDPITSTFAFAANAANAFTLANNPFADTSGVVGFSLSASGSFAAAKLEAESSFARGQISASARLVGRIAF